MKTVRFFRVGAIAVALMLALTAAKSRVDDYNDAMSTAADAGLNYSYGNMGTNISQLTTYYDARSSTYSSNLSAWSTWSSYATTEEASSVSALLSDEDAQLGKMSGNLSLLSGYKSQAISDYGNYSTWASGLLGTPMGNNYPAQQMLAYISDWEDQIETFGSGCGLVTNNISDFDSDDSSFDSILDAIIARNS
jgi:hypothetical protein